MSKKLKIATFYNLPLGGELKAMHDNLKFLKNNGHEIDVYTVDVYTKDKSNESYAPLEKFVDNYYVYPVPRSRFRKIIVNIINKIIPSINISDDSEMLITLNKFKKAQKIIANDINNKDYDLILLGKDASFTISPVILEYLKKPTVYYCQDPYRNEEIITKLDKLVPKKLHEKLYSEFFSKRKAKFDVKYAQYADHILVNSYFSHETLLRVYGLNSQVSYLGINTELFACKNLLRENFVLSVGHMAPAKGFDFIIKSLGKIDKKIRPKLIITGYASAITWKNYIIDLAKDEDVELEILENITYDELIELYNKAKLFVFGSYLEPFGLVPLEAMACGTPVVAVKEGGIKETVKDGITGYLVDRDEIKFGNAISELLTNDVLWNKFSKAGPPYVNEYWTLEQGGQRLLDNINNILIKEKRFED